MTENAHPSVNTANMPILSDRLVGNYFSNLVDLFFKILPLWENREKTLPIYMETLLDELIGLEVATSYADG